MRRKGLLRGALVTAVAAAAGLASTPAASADSGTAATKAEAWYQIAPVAAPAGSPAVVPPTYGSDTLHVGITHGQENARTYLTLDLSALPDAATVEGGTLRLPVDPGDGSTAPETARFQACFVADPPADTAGSLEAPPAYDCGRASVPAIYQEGPAPSFAVDLAPFASQLRSGGLALVPTDAARAAGDTWHVTLYGRHSSSPGAQPVTASIEFSPAASGTAASDAAGEPAGQPGLSPADVAAAPSSPAFVGPVAEIGVPPAAPAAAPMLAGPPGPPDGASVSGTAPAFTAVNAATDLPGVSRGFAYSVVWFLPLALLGLGWVLVWALTRSPLPDDI